MTSPADLPRGLRLLADLAEIRGAQLESLGLRRAAAAIEALGPDGPVRVSKLARRKRLSELPAISPNQYPAIRELVRSGRDVIRAARATIPRLPRGLLELTSVTSEQAAWLARDLGIATRPDLERALDDGRIKQHLGEQVARLLSAAAEALAFESRPLTLGRAWDLLDSLLPTLADTVPGLSAIEPAGDIRRYEPLITAVVLVGRSENPEAAVDAICAMPGVVNVLHRSPARAIITWQDAEIDIRVAAPDDYGTVLFTCTGSRAHLAALAARRRQQVLCAREEQVYAHAGLSWIAPELRNASGEIEAAASGRLPALVERRDIRGDLHMHSTYSDGRDTIAEMIRACYALGYEYIAITDHSERAAASRTLRVDEVSRQRDEIDRLRERFPGIAILHGVEVDILPDGRLDFDDRLLERFELVLASLHDRAGQDGDQLTRRSLEAIRHPLVTILTHPANRLVGRHNGYPLNFEVLYAAAAETGTALEVDGAPGHLDLDGDHARAAAATGVTLSIDSDCHRASSLERQMRLAVGTARRGWVEPAQVLNTRSFDNVRAFVAAKRRSHSR